MAQVRLQVTARPTLGTTAAQTLRRTGWIPGVIYGQGRTPQPVMVEQRAFLHALHTKAGENVVLNLDVLTAGVAPATKGKAGKAGGTTVLLKDVQHHPVDGSIRHVDFQQISLTETIHVHVPVVAVGESVGVKQDNGVLEYLLREIEVECLPTQIPERFTLDVSGLKIGDSLHVKDVTLPAGVTLRHGDPEAVVLSVLAVKEEQPADVVPGAEETAEPEVLKQKKPEELEAEAAAKAAEKPEKGKKQGEAEAKKE